MLNLTKKRVDAGGLPLWNAVFCLDCEVISNSRGNECPVCSSRSLVSLARILGGSLYAHRNNQFQECENELFDITITVELKRMYANELTTTLERLSGIIGPKMARDQATFRVNVKPEDRFKLQGLLCFPERDAA